MGSGSAPASRGAAKILDEAVQLLRRGGAGPLLIWCAGTVPFVLAFLFFWTQMSYGAFARERLLGYSAGIAAVYFWMKVWQSAFAMRLRQELENGRPSRPSLSEWSRIATVQVRYQPSALLVLPLAAILVLPFGWLYAFYQNLAVMGSVGPARKCALQWPRQNHLIIAALSVCALVMFINILSAIFVLPWLGQTVFGFSSQISQSPWLLLNSTTLVVATCLSYLVLGPLVKAVYVLRCFYGDAQTTGADLRLELSRMTGGSRP